MLPFPSLGYLADSFKTSWDPTLVRAFSGQIWGNFYMINDKKLINGIS